MKNFHFLLLYVLLIGIAGCKTQPGTKTEGAANPKCVANPKPDCMCTLQYDPVCGCDGVTYGNDCAAACARVDIKYKGECRK